MKNKYRKMICRVIAVLLMVIPVAGANMPLAAKASTETLTATVTYMQSDARALLTMVNDFRQSEDAWYWDTDNETKIYPVNLETLRWDYNLEQIAMQRAMEAAIRFSHTRLDGSDCFSLTYNGTQSWAENLAAGHTTAEEVFLGWKEDDKDFYGQGHRRNMLGWSSEAIGIAHVVFEGVHYWAMEFGMTNSGASDPGVVDGPVTRSFQIDSAMLEPVLEPAEGFGAGDFQYGLSRNLPKMRVRLYIAGDEEGSRWGRGFAVDPSEYSLKWEPEFPDRIEIHGDKYYAVGLGDCYVIASTEYRGVKLEYRFWDQVCERRVWEYSIDPIPEQQYTGEEVCPHTKVMVEDQVLTEGRDYFVSYQNNIEPGYDALMIITFSDNFKFYWRDEKTFIRGFAILPTPTPIPTSTPTVQPTATPILTNTPTVQPTATPIPTNTPTVQPTATPILTNTPTVQPTATPIPTNTPTVQPTATPVPTKAPTVQPTATPIPTNTPTPQPTSTPIPTKAPTVQPTPTLTPTIAPTAALTQQLTPTVFREYETDQDPAEPVIQASEPSVTPGLPAQITEASSGETETTETSTKENAQMTIWYILVILLATSVFFGILMAIANYMREQSR